MLHPLAIIQTVTYSASSATGCSHSRFAASFTARRVQRSFPTTLSPWRKPGVDRLDRDRSRRQIAFRGVAFFPFSPDGYFTVGARPNPPGRSAGGSSKSPAVPDACNASNQCCGRVRRAGGPPCCRRWNRGISWTGSGPPRSSPGCSSCKYAPKRCYSWWRRTYRARKASWVMLALGTAGEILPKQSKWPSTVLRKTTMSLGADGLVELVDKLLEAAPKAVFRMKVEPLVEDRQCPRFLTLVVLLPGTELVCCHAGLRWHAFDTV